jgi:hypothetical protein
VAAVQVGRLPEVPPDTRPIGSLLNADPCSAAFAQAIHPFKPLEEHLDQTVHEAHVGTPHGIRTVDKRILRYYDPIMERRRQKDEE